tara:strand:- start:23711 stop:24724 length:1014 start_codon:yes stop_codon:yes gene_type:complete
VKEVTPPELREPKVSQVVVQATELAGGGGAIVNNTGGTRFANTGNSEPIDRSPVKIYRPFEIEILDDQVLLHRGYTSTTDEATRQFDTVQTKSDGIEFDLVAIPVAAPTDIWVQFGCGESDIVILYNDDPLPTIGEGMFLLLLHTFSIATGVIVHDVDNSGNIQIVTYEDLCQSSSSSSSSSSSTSSSASSSGTGASSSSKNTAVVPFPRYPKGFASLYCEESLTVNFNFIQRFAHAGTRMRHSISQDYLDVIENYRIEGFASCYRPISIGVKVSNGCIDLHTSESYAGEITVRFVAIRKGFGDIYLEETDEKRFLSNERFINSNKPKSWFRRLVGL